MEHSLIIDATLVLVTTTVLVAGTSALRLSPVIAYLLAGFVIGPYGFDWLSANGVALTLAELGVVLLMFTVGLEISLPRLLAVKKLVLGLGGLQVLLTSCLTGGILLVFFQVSPLVALLLGGAMAMSSTAIILKQLTDTLELETPHGRVAHSVLIFQDLVAVFLLATIDVLASNTGALLVDIGLVSMKVLGLVLLLTFFGRRILPAVLERVMAVRSLELFMLVALFLAMAAAGLALAFGLSPTLGAFMAGMLLGETSFRYQLEADIRPFRDLMLGLFFITLAMQLNMLVIADHWISVLLFFMLLSVLKPMIVMPVVRLFGFSSPESSQSALYLGQGGEFGLLIISFLLASNSVSQELAQPLLASIILSMFVAPLMILLSGRLVSIWNYQSSNEKPPVDIETRIKEFADDYDKHVIVCGYGRIGQNLSRILLENGYSVVAMDLDAQRVHSAVLNGEPVVFGNADQPGVLRAAGLDRARAVALAMDNARLAKRISQHIRQQRIDLPILARSSEGKNDELLETADVTVFPEGLETSLAFSGQMLHLLGIPCSRVEQILNAIRVQNYAEIRPYIHSSDARTRDIESLNYPVQRKVLVLEEEHYAVGRTSYELNIEQQGFTLESIRRNGSFIPVNLLDTRLRVGDVLVLSGTFEAIDQAERLLYFGCSDLLKKN